MIDEQQFIAAHPFLYHAATAGSWASIQRNGLLCGARLFELCRTDEDAGPLARKHRPAPVTLDHPRLGRVTIRDQKPMTPAAIGPLLGDGLTPADWYELLNGFVFFWASRPRLEKLLAAYPNEAHDVVVVETGKIVPLYRDRMRFVSFNSGAVGRGRKERGRGSFRRLYELTGDVVEVVIPDAVPDVRDFVVGVERWQGTTRIGTVL